MSRIEQNVRLLDDGGGDNGEIDTDSEYQASVYNYDTSSEVESVKSNNSSIKRKTFKPSLKKKIQLTFENLSVKTIPKRKNLLCCEYGQATQSKTILDKVSGTFVPGQFVAILGASGKKKSRFNGFRIGKDHIFELLVWKDTWIKFKFVNERKDLIKWKEQRQNARLRIFVVLCSAG